MFKLNSKVLNSILSLNSLGTDWLFFTAALQQRFCGGCVRWLLVGVGARSAVLCSKTRGFLPMQQQQRGRYSVKVMLPILSRAFFDHNYNPRFDLKVKVQTEVSSSSAKKNNKIEKGGNDGDFQLRRRDTCATPLDMDASICIEIDRFMIYGRSYHWVIHQ